MSQRNLKCTVCSGSHSQLHCTFTCKSCGGDYSQCKCETVNHQSSANETLKPGRPIPSVTTKNSRSGMTAYWKTTKDLHKPSKIRKKKRNSLDSSEGKGERVWRSSEWCRRAGQPGSNKMWSLKDAGEKTRWGQKTHCKLKTRASVSKEQFISQRTAASRPTTTAIDPRQ